MQKATLKIMQKLGFSSPDVLFNILSQCIKLLIRNKTYFQYIHNF